MSREGGQRTLFLDEFSCPCKKFSLRFFMTVSRDEHIKFEAVACYQ